MRILLQNFETGLYFKALGEWTDSALPAMCFPDPLRATAYKIRHRLTGTFAVVVPDHVRSQVSPAVQVSG